MHIGGSNMEIKTEADRNHITEYAHNDKPNTGMFGVSVSLFCTVICLCVTCTQFTLLVSCCYFAMCIINDVEYASVCCVVSVYVIELSLLTKCHTTLCIVFL